MSENEINPTDPEEGVPVESTEADKVEVEESACQPDLNASTDVDRITVLERERDENHERWLRSQADLENLRRRHQRELEELRKYQFLPLIRDFLPGLDNLHRAVEAAQKTSSIDELLTGVEMVTKSFEDILKRHSATAIQAIGQPFDPNLHEAVQQVPSDEYPPMTVIHELERGFVLDDRVIRPSKVVVSCPPPNSSSDPVQETD